MEHRWARVTHVQERAGDLAFEAFSQEFGSAVLLSYRTRSGLLKTGRAPVSRGLNRSTHALVPRMGAPTSPIIGVLSEEDWERLDAHGQLWLPLPWEARVAESDWLTVGRRAAADIVINDYTVSTQHAQVRRIGSGEVLAVTDLGSTNGTEAGGDILSEGEQAEVESRGVVVFGRQVFVYLSCRDFYDLLCGDDIIPAASEIST